MNITLKIRKTTRAILLAGTMLLMLLPGSVSADVGIDQPTAGGVITPGSKTAAVKMKNERVVFQVKQGTGPFSEAYVGDDSSESERYYARVTATFTMQNLTGQAVTQNLVFPFHLLFTEQTPAIQQAKNASITVNGATVAATYDNNTPFAEAPAAAGHFSATFAAKSDTTIVVAYDLRAVRQAKSPNLTFQYMMQTGSHWADAIGSGEIVFDFGQAQIDSTAPFATINDVFKPKNGKLVWEFSNLEPTAAHDITVAFDPYILNTVWPKRQTFISNLVASNVMTQGTICGNTRFVSPDCNTIIDDGQELGVGPVWVNPSPANLLIPEDVSKESGWLVPYKEGEKFQEWLEFTFDGNYTFSGLQIRAGYLDTNPDYSNGYTDTPGAFYDSFRRPKTVIVTYADGSSETVTLGNEPAAMQTLTLKKAASKATNKIRLAFADTYPGVNHGNGYFGVGRVQFVGAKKAAAQLSNDKSGAGTNAAQAAKTDSPPYRTVAFGAIGVGAAVILLYGIARFIGYLIARRRETPPKPPAAPRAPIADDRPDPKPFSQEDKTKE